MRNRLKTSIALATLLLAMVSSHAQNAIVNFGYDANGNRISRTLTVAKVEEKGKSDDITTTLDFISEETNAFGGVTVSIYPNPTHDKLTVSIQGLRENHVIACLIATTGAILIQQELCKDVHDLDLSSLPSGMYLLQLSASNMTQILKIIKE